MRRRDEKEGGIRGRAGRKMRWCRAIKMEQERWMEGKSEEEGE